MGGVLLIVLLAAISIALFVVLGKKVFQRALGRLGARAMPGTGATRTFRFSFGTKPEAVVTAPDLTPIPAARRGVELDSSRRRHYLEAWHQAEARFADSPDEAVRNLHRLTAELMQDLGTPTRQFESVMTVRLEGENLLEGLGDIVEQVQGTQSAARGISLALAHRPADPADLRAAMDLYARVLQDLLIEKPADPGG